MRTSSVRGHRITPDFGQFKKRCAWRAEGMTNPEIGAKLFMSRATVKAHLSRVYAKLGIASRAELAAEAARRGA